MPTDVLDDTGRLEAGLDALEARRLARTTWRQRLVRSVVPPVVALVVLVALWQGVAIWGVRTGTLPGPAAVWRSFTDLWGRGDAPAAVANSLRRGGLGFVASIAVGTVLGLLLSQVRVVRAGVGPLLAGLQSLPSIAWVPAAILWFGRTDAAIYVVVLLGAIPSVANGLLAGIDQVPPSYGRVATVLGAGRLGAIRHVTLPAALPGYLAGLRQGWAFSWRALMAAELIAYSTQLGPGLGQLLDTGRRQGEVPLVLAAILLILLVGIAVELAVFGPIERRVLSARGLTGS